MVLNTSSSLWLSSQWQNHFVPEQITVSFSSSLLSATAEEELACQKRVAAPSTPHPTPPTLEADIASPPEPYFAVILTVEVYPALSPLSTSAATDVTVNFQLENKVSRWV